MAHVAGRYHGNLLGRNKPNDILQEALPIEVCSGDVVRHRLSRAEDRQLNYCLHVMAITQISRDTAGRAYYLRKRSAGKSHKEALHCLKRRRSDTGYRQLVRDATAGVAGPDEHPGDDSHVLRGQLKPRTPALRTSHFPDPPAATYNAVETAAFDTKRRHSTGRARLLVRLFGRVC